MGLLDRLLARLENSRPAPAGPAGAPHVPWPRPQDPAPLYGAPGTQPSTSAAGTTEEAAADAAAIERYRYMLRTAPPEAVEQAHAEAFARLTPDQRRTVLSQLSDGVPASDRPVSDDPLHLARAATRAEMRQPGTLERLLGRAGGPGRIGLGGLLAGGLLASVAGGVIGSAIGTEMFADEPGCGGGSGGDGDGGGQDAADAWAGGDSGGWGDGGDF